MRNFELVTATCVTLTGLNNRLIEKRHDKEHTKDFCTIQITYERYGCTIHKKKNKKKISALHNKLLSLLLLLLKLFCQDGLTSLLFSSTFCLLFLLKRYRLLLQLYQLPCVIFLLFVLILANQNHTEQILKPQFEIPVSET